MKKGERMRMKRERADMRMRRIERGKKEKVTRRQMWR